MDSQDSRNPDRRAIFTRTEFVVLFFIGVIFVFVLGPLTRAIKRPADNTSVTMAHMMGALCYAYSTDHHDTYPYGPDGHSIANLLLNLGYANHPDIFFVAGTAHSSKYTGSTSPYNLTAANCNWDFMVSGTTGLASTANDLTPLCQLTAGIAVEGLPTSRGSGITLKVDPRITAYDADGIAVYYKGNNSVFIKCEVVSFTEAVNRPTSPIPYVGPEYADPLGATYHTVLP